jgi:hypothetical protein
MGLVFRFSVVFVHYAVVFFCWKSGFFFLLIFFSVLIHALESPSLVCSELLMVMNLI